MAIGRNFTEALQKALRSLESPGRAVFGWATPRRPSTRRELAGAAPSVPHDGRLRDVQQALLGRRHRRAGARGHRHRPVVPRPDRAAQRGRRRGRATRPSSTATCCARAKRHGFSDAQIGRLRGMPEDVVRGVRHALGHPAGVQDRRHLRGRVRGADAVPLLLLRRGDRGRAARRAGRASSSAAGRTGSGRASSSTTPACTRRSRCASAGYETVMVNCNPETVSTDYDTSRPALLRAAHPRGRPRGRARRAARPARCSASSCSSAARRRSAWRSGSRTPACPIVGTSPEAIHLAEDRGAFGRGARRRRPARAQARHRDVATTGARRIAADIGYPVLVRPSYVLGGRGMEIVYDDEQLADLHGARPPRCRPDRPVLVDRFLDDAIEIDVDALFDGDELYLGGVMEHIEEAGIHSGDSACVLPPVTLGPRRDRPRSASSTEALAARRRRARPAQRAVRAGRRRALRARGQPAAPAAPRRSSPRRPAVPLAKAAARVMLGATDRRPARGGPAARARRRRPTLPASTRRSRSRRRCCRSSGSAPSRAAASTTCSARRCARPAR